MSHCEGINSTMNWVSLSAHVICPFPKYIFWTCLWFSKCFSRGWGYFDKIQPLAILVFSKHFEGISNVEVLPSQHLQHISFAAALYFVGKSVL